MTTCARCGRTLDSTENKYSADVRGKPGDAAAIWCADCLLKSPPYTNSR